jgi:ADP-ribose pyrophosphatase
VEGLSPFDERESRDQHAFLQWLATTTDIYRRAKPSTPDRHLAVYCVPVNLPQRRVYLGFHLGAQHWLPPGGHVDIGESPCRAALRECSEELGTTLPLIQDSPVMASVEQTVGANVHADMVFWFAFDGGWHESLRLTEDEFADQRWFSFSEIASTHTNPSLGRFLAKLEGLHGSPDEASHGAIGAPR